MHGEANDVAVIGAGLIGLATAFELSQRGAAVRVYDRGEPGRAASWAGAGMLAPYTEGVEDDAMLQLCGRSLALYPSFVRRVRDAGGIEPQLHLNGILSAAFDRDQMERLRMRAGELSARNVEYALLDRTETIAQEPCLGSNVVGALVVSGEGSVDNRRLGRALTAACEASGVTIVRDADVAIECDSRRVLGIRTSRGFSPVKTAINAAGAWSAEVRGIPKDCVPPVFPVKGQMLALAIPHQLVRRTTWVPGAYLVPRDDGRLLVGATVEPRQFDERVTAGGVRGLLDAALAAAPALADFSITETWAGLRPGTADDRPILGPCAIDGLVLATGHFRNGILLAPVTANVIASFVEAGADGSLAPFLLARFETEAARS